MAQTGYTPILIYSSTTASQAPSAGNLTNSTLGSELAINITDGKLFYKDNGGSVQVIAWKVTPTSAGGTGLTSYTAGDTLYYATGTTLSKLAIGASKTIMTSSGTAPQWSASLDTSQGGTGNTSYTAGDMNYYASGTAFTKLAIGVSGRWLGSSGTAPQWNAPAALTKTDDTNVTLTLGGNASTALLNAASLTLGWTGTLAVSRGGIGTGTAGIGAFNNITGYTASGATGTTSTNLVFSTSPSITTPTLVGNSTMSTGNLIQGTAAKGVNFTANTPAAGKTSQLLNDYEEGTWSPTIVGDTGASGQTYATQIGFYTKIGRFVTCNFWVQLSNAGTLTGSWAGIGNLPFTSKNTSSLAAVGPISYFSDLANAWILISSAQVGANSTFAYFFGRKAATAATSADLVPIADIGNSTRIQGTITYIV